VALVDPEGNAFCIERGDIEHAPTVEQLGRAFAAVGDHQGPARTGSAPTPCTDWTVLRLVNDLIGMNRVFAGGTAPDPVVDALPDPPRCRGDQLDAAPGHTAGQSAGDDSGYWYATRP